MRPSNDELFDWILSLGPRAKYNFTLSGLSEPDFRSMGIDTSFERFAAEKDEHERLFAEEVARIYGAEPGNVVITAGASEAIFLAYSVLGSGKRAVVPLPNYPPMFTVPRALGMQVTNSLSPRSAARGAICGLTDPNNPTGKSLQEGLVDSVIDSARGTRGTVFVNETYKEYEFPLAPRTRFGESGEVVTCSTMTKFYGLGRFRVGWILADERQARHLHYGKWAVSGHDSSYSLWIATQVLKKRTTFAKRAHEIHSKNVEHVRRFLRDTDGVSAELGVGPFCMVSYKKGPGSVALAKSLLEKVGVLVSPGDFFGAPRTFRLCFTGEEENLQAGLAALSGYFN